MRSVIGSAAGGAPTPYYPPRAPAEHDWSLYLAHGLLPAGRARSLEGMSVRAQVFVTCDARRALGCHVR
jgi:hypothetical protein